jgi:prepilin-type N-terminal cleavage/methylation domain-containing protein
MFRMSQTKSVRRGFTLVELTVVVALIAVLVALSAGVAWNVVASQRSARTDDTIRTIDKVFKIHWRKVIEDADSEQPSPGVVALAVNDMARAKILWRIIRLSEAFPESYAEVTSANTQKGLYLGNYQLPSVKNLGGTYYYTYPILNGNPLIPPGQQKYTATYAAGIANANASDDAITQSSACLFLALSQNRGGKNKLDQTNLANNIASIDNGNLKILVDTWNQPLRFVRFPIYHPGAAGNDYAQVAQDFLQLDPRAGSKQVKFSDPVDPDGTLQGVPTGGRLPWYRTPLPVPPAGKTPPATYGQFLEYICNHPFGTNAQPQTYWIPIIASSGGDGLPYTGDDHYNYKLRVGAQGD